MQNVLFFSLSPQQESENLLKESLRAEAEARRARTRQRIAARVAERVKDLEAQGRSDNEVNAEEVAIRAAGEAESAKLEAVREFCEEKRLRQGWQSESTPHRGQQSRGRGKQIENGPGMVDTCARTCLEGMVLDTSRCVRCFSMIAESRSSPRRLPLGFTRLARRLWPLRVL